MGGRLLLAAVLCGCATTDPFAADRGLFSATDAVGDVRLEHPPADGIGAGTFDLTALSLAYNDEFLVVTATFAAPVRARRVMGLQERRRSVFPQTVDVYIDAVPGAGATAALEGRGFSVDRGWDTVLVLSSLQEVRADAHVVYPVHLVARESKLVGLFRLADVPARLMAVQAVVLATSPHTDGRVLAASTWRGDCRSHAYERCTLFGDGPPVMDALDAVTPGAPLAMREVAR